MEQGDDESWKNKRMEWVNAMWDNNGSTTIREEECLPL
jgi:hypothetical protein